jgi:hypothetical protein
MSHYAGELANYLGEALQRLPASRKRLPPRPPMREGKLPSRDRMIQLMEALGNPEHPEHARAVNTLVDIGSPALPWLTEALNPRLPWLTSYRAAEAMGRIGDGNATGALIQALRHPNSNVRWSTVRALSQLGDLRAIVELRRVAHHDHGRTSWGESVGTAAQHALDQMRTRSMWGQSIELIKTAVTSVLMILALVLAFSMVSTLRNELSRIGEPGIGANMPGGLALSPEASPAAGAAAETTPTPFIPTPEPTVPPNTPTPEVLITGTVLQGANVRPEPSINNTPIGQLRLNDQVEFVARTPDSEWYLVRLADDADTPSTIDNPDGSEAGWVNQALLSRPIGDVPVQDELATGTTPTPTSSAGPLSDL